MKIKKILFIVCAILFLSGCEKKMICPNGYQEQNDKTCIKEMRIPANMSYYCNGIDTLSDNICTNTITSVAIMSYECPSGYTSYGNMCKKTGGILNLSECGANHTYLNGMCYLDYIGTLKYTCLNGRQIGALCYIDTVYDALINYSCDDDYELVGQECIKIETEEMIEK